MLRRSRSHQESQLVLRIDLLILETTGDTATGDTATGDTDCCFEAQSGAGAKRGEENRTFLIPSMAVVVGTWKQ